MIGWEVISMQDDVMGCTFEAVRTRVYVCGSEVISMQNGGS